MLLSLLAYLLNKLTYRPSFWFEIKWGWVQYLAVFIPLTWFLDWLRIFIYANGVCDPIAPRASVQLTF